MSRVRILSVGQCQDTDCFVKSIQDFCGSGWTGEAAHSIDAALSTLDSATFDMVIVDADWTETNIVQFLKTVSERWPSILRYVVTNATERNKLVMLVEVCHQVLLKSADVRLLAKNLANAVNLRDIMTDESLKARISGIKSIPCLPETYSQLVTEMRDPDVSLKRIADLVSTDSAVSAKVLQVVNSAYFGLSSQTEDISHAVTILGLDTLQSLVLSAGVFSQFQQLDIPGSSIENLFSDGTRISAISRLLGTSLGLPRREIESSLLSGMLNDFGKLIMAKYFRNEFKQAVEAAQQQAIPLHLAVEQLIGADDALIGAYILSMWGLSDSIVEAVAFHHKPSKCPQPIMGTLTLVHLAWALNQDEKGLVQNGPESAIDSEYLSALQLSAHLPMLRSLSAAAV